MAESAEELQRALNAVYEYCNNWDLTVNTDKTKIVIFSRGKVRLYPAFLFGHNHLEVVDEYGSIHGIGVPKCDNRVEKKIFFNVNEIEQR